MGEWCAQALGFDFDRFWNRGLLTHSPIWLRVNPLTHASTITMFQKNVGLKRVIFFLQKGQMGRGGKDFTSPHQCFVFPKQSEKQIIGHNLFSNENSRFFFTTR